MKNITAQQAAEATTAFIKEHVPDTLIYAINDCISRCSKEGDTTISWILPKGMSLKSIQKLLKIYDEMGYFVMADVGENKITISWMHLVGAEDVVKTSMWDRFCNWFKRRLS